jgi:hypothetical protein
LLNKAGPDSLFDDVHLTTFLDVTTQAISLDFKLLPKIRTKADFTYSITPDTILITDTTNGRALVKNAIHAVLSKIEYWHQGSIR